MAGRTEAALERRPRADLRIQEQLEALKVKLLMAEKAVSEASALLEGLERRQALPCAAPGSNDGESVEASSPEAGRRLITVTDWPKYHPWPKVSGLRHMIFHRKANGFDRVLRRVGRRVLIHEGAFFEWVEERGGRAAITPHTDSTQRSPEHHGRR